MCPLIKKLNQAFISKYAVGTLKHSAELLKHAGELLKALERTRGSMESLKSSAICLCYNAAHAILISHGNFHI